MKTVSVALHRSDPIQVPAHFVGSLAVHKEIDAEYRLTRRHGKRAEWVITHAPSGRAVYGFKTRAGAMEGAKAVSCLADWSTDSPQETFTSAEREAIKNALVAVWMVEAEKRRPAYLSSKGAPK